MKKSLTKPHSERKFDYMNEADLDKKPFVTKGFAERVASIRARYGSLTAYFARRGRNVHEESVCRTTTPRATKLKRILV